MEKLTLHHPAFVVRDAGRLIDFYGRLGFEKMFEWTADDGSLSIFLLGNGEATVELFAPAQPDGCANSRVELEADLRVPGIRHVAFRTPNMERLLEELKGKGIEPAVPPRVGRTGRKIAFIKDPEGNWVEFVEGRA